MSPEAGRSRGLLRSYRSAIVVAVLIVALVVGFVVPAPWHQAQVDQHGVGAWVVPNSASPGEVHLIDTGEGGVACSVPVTDSTEYHVATDGSTSYLWDAQTVQPLDPDSCKVGTALSGLQGSIEGVKVGGGGVVVHTSSGTYSATNSSTTATALPAKGVTHVAVGADGTKVVATSSSVRETTPAGSTTTVNLPSSTFCAGVCQVQVVGGHAVVLSGTTLWFDDGTQVQVPKDAQLGSTVTAAADTLPVITSQGLAAYGAGGGLAWTMPASSSEAGLAATTDWQGCSYGAWTSSGSVVVARQCGTDQPVRRTLDPSTASPACSPVRQVDAGSWQFQSANGAAVLNAPSGDAYFLVGNRLTCEQWQTIQHNGQPTSATQARKLAKSTITCRQATFYLSADNTAPQWPAVENCTDSAGYPMWVKAQSLQDPFRVGSDGASISLSVSPGTQPPGSVAYTVTDGTTSQSTSALITTSANEPGPQKRRDSAAVFLPPQGGVTYDVLEDWYSMLGTPLTVTDAIEIAPSTTSVHIQDGRFLVVSNYSGQPETVTVSVEDTEGKRASYPVALQPAGGAGSAPVVHDVLTSGQSGQPLNADLVAGDTDPKGGSLSVEHWTPVTAGNPNCPVKAGATEITCTFPSAGEYVWSYDVASSISGQHSTAFARFDVSPSGLQVDSVAAALPIQGQTTVDLLGPEVNRQENVAVVDAQCPPAAAGSPAPFTCALIGDRYLRIVWQSSLKVTAVPFTVTDGVVPAPVTAVLWVTPYIVPASESAQLATVPTQTVSAGGVIRVPVLTGAYSPYGWDMSVTQASVVNASTCPSLATWNDGTNVYVYAKLTATPTACQVDYQAQVSQGADPAAIPGSFSVEVGAPPPPAEPPTLTLRLRGSSGLVELPSSSDPTASVTPSGEPVEWLPDDVGNPTAPSCGTAKLTSDYQYIEYTTSGKGCPIDSFSYQMLRLDGTVAQGTVKVVGSPTSGCGAPTALPITRYVPIGQSDISVAVQGSIADPCGRTASVTRVLAKSACISATPGGGGTVVVSGLTNCPPTLATVSVRYSYSVPGVGSASGGGSLLTGDITIVRGADGTDLSAHDDMTPLAPSAHIDLTSLVSGNVGPLTFLSVPGGGGCTISGSVLTAPAQPPSDNISPCPFLAVDTTTKAVVGGVVWLAGRKPLIRQERTDDVVVAPGKKTTVDVVGGTNPYFDVVPTTYRLTLASARLSCQGGSSPGQPSLSGGQVTIDVPAPQDPISCTLLAQITVSPGGSDQGVSLPVLLEGQKPAGVISCSAPTLYPGESQVPWDLTSCIEPGGFAFGKLSITATSRSTGVVNVTEPQGGVSDPIVFLSAAPDTAGQSAAITVTVDDGTDPPAHEAVSVSVHSTPCSLSVPGMSKVTLTGGATQTVPLPVSTSGANCSWQIVGSPSAVATGTPLKLIVTPSGDGHELIITAPTLPAGQSGSFSVGFLVQATKDSSINAQGSVSVILSGPPGVPSGVAATADSSTATASVIWAQLGADRLGGATNVTYNACANAGSPCGGRDGTSGIAKCSIVNASGCTLAGPLQANQAYQVTVTACTENGCTPSVPQTLQMLGPPPKPSSVTAQDEKDGQALVQWTEPAPSNNDPRDAITGFIVTGSKGGACTVPPGPGATSCYFVVTSPGSQSFTVAATNSYSTAGGPSLSSAEIPVTAAPTIAVESGPNTTCGADPTNCTAVTGFSVNDGGNLQCTIEFSLENQSGAPNPAIPSQGCSVAGLTVQGLYARVNYTLNASVLTAPGQPSSMTVSPEIVGALPTGLGTPSISFNGTSGCHNPDAQDVVNCQWSQTVAGLGSTYSLTFGKAPCNSIGDVQSTGNGMWALGFQCSGESTAGGVSYTLHEEKYSATGGPTSVPAPTITSISPGTGSTSTTTPVVISGTNLSGATSVTFGGVVATITSDTATSISVTVPMGTATGTVDVVVTTPGGTVTDPAAFNYT